MLKLSLRQPRRRLGRGRLMRYWEYTDLNSVKCYLSRPERDSPIFLLRLCPSLILFSRPSSIKKLFSGTNLEFMARRMSVPLFIPVRVRLKMGFRGSSQPTTTLERRGQLGPSHSRHSTRRVGVSGVVVTLRPHIYSFTFSAHSVQCVLLLLLSLLHIVENRYYASRYIYIPHGWMDGPHTSRTVFCQWKCWS